MDTDTIDVQIAGDIGFFTVDSALIKRLAYKVMSHLGVAHYELSIQFSSQESIRDLNSRFRHKDRSTDVLSFPQEEFASPLKASHTQQDSYVEQDPPKCLGDLVISLVDAQRNALSIGQSLDREVCFLLVHGLLHLCGHDHEEPEQEKVMMKEQNFLMSMLTANQHPLWRQCVENVSHA